MRAISKTVHFLGGLQTHGQGDKATMLHQACEASRVLFHPIDWQNPKHGHIGEWAQAIVDGLEPYRPVDVKHRKVLVASSMAVWPALIALAQMGNAAVEFVDHFVAVSPVIDATAAFADKFTDGKTVIEVPCGADVPAFPLTPEHVKRAEPLLIRKQGHTWMEQISTKIGLTVLAGPDDQKIGSSLMRIWPKGARLWPEMSGIATAFKPIELKAAHYVQNEDDTKLIVSTAVRLALQANIR